MRKEVQNRHDSTDKNKTFAYVEYTTKVEENEITIKLAIKKSPQKNKFWVHSVYTTENVSDSPASTNKGTEAGHITADNGDVISHPDEIVNSKSKENSENISEDMFSGRDPIDIEQYKKVNRQLEKENAELKHGDYYNADTKWTVFAGDVLNGDTRHHSGGNRINVKALNTIEKIIDSAVLFDTVVSDRNTNKKSVNTAFLHKLYSVLRYDGKEYIAKITVEEFYDESKNKDALRAYNLKTIKIEPAGGGEGHSPTTHNVGGGSINSISDLYRFVKTFDKEFSAAPEANPFVSCQSTIR